jgi:hypothetical protein
VGPRGEIVQKLVERVPTLEAVHQVLQGNSRPYENGCPAQDVWIRMDDVVDGHAVRIRLAQRLTAPRSATRAARALGEVRSSAELDGDSWERQSVVVPLREE